MQALADVEKNASNFSETVESIRMESQKKRSLGKRRIQEKEQLLEKAEKKVKLTEERDETMGQLERTEREVYFLRTHQDTDEELRVIIAGKEAEIKILKERLVRVERDLAIANNECERLRVQLEQTTVELVKQSE